MSLGFVWGQGSGELARFLLVLGLVLLHAGCLSEGTIMTRSGTTVASPQLMSDSKKTAEGLSTPRRGKSAARGKRKVGVAAGSETTNFDSPNNDVQTLVPLAERSVVLSEHNGVAATAGTSIVASGCTSPEPSSTRRSIFDIVASGIEHPFPQSSMAEKSPPDVRRSTVRNTSLLQFPSRSQSHSPMTSRGAPMTIPITVQEDHGNEEVTKCAQEDVGEGSEAQVAGSQESVKNQEDGIAEERVCESSPAQAAESQLPEKGAQTVAAAVKTQQGEEDQDRLHRPKHSPSPIMGKSANFEAIPSDGDSPKVEHLHIYALDSILSFCCFTIFQCIFFAEEILFVSFVLIL